MASRFYALTKMDITALRQCDDIIVRRDPDAKVYCIKRVRPSETNPFATDVHHSIDAPVEFAHRWDVDTSRCNAFAFVGNYPTQITPLGSMLATLRVGDEISFSFFVNGAGTPAMQEVHFYSDVLYLNVYRNGKHAAKWVFDQHTCADGQSRMIKGSFPKVFEDQKAIAADHKAIASPCCTVQ